MSIGLSSALRMPKYLLLIGLIAGSAWAETSPSLNMYGATGLIDMPSAEMQSDGMLTTTSSHFGPISRTTLTFQITPRLSGSFRFLGIRDWNKNSGCLPACTGIDQFNTYYDRSFDLRYQILREGRYLPAVTIGLQDFVGTGIIAGEYVVATKNVTPSVKVSAGLGWGRLGSNGSIGSPFGARPPLVIGSGGNFNFDQWFRGPAAPFGGLEWQIDDKWAFKAEYSSDAYAEEAGARRTFDRKSPFNFGIEYQRNKNLRLGAYYMYGSQIGISANILLRPKASGMSSFSTGAPDPVLVRPSRAVSPDEWTTEWLSQADAAPILRGNLAERLSPDRIDLRSLDYDGQTVRVSIQNNTLDAEAQAIGRTARALSQTMPASVEVFEIVPIVNGMPVSRVIIRRADLEAFEFDTNGDAAMLARSQVVAAPIGVAGAFTDEALYPRLTWSLSPMARTRFFDQNAPFKIGAGLQLSGKYDLTPNLTLKGKVTKILVGNLNDRPPIPGRTLQPVRSASFFYDSMGDPALEELSLSYYHKLGPEVYGRATVGYIERMFGGLSTEVLWMPTDRRWAIGAELNYVAQRSPSQGLGFSLPAAMFDTDSCGDPGQPACNTRSKYSVLTGHISGYYKFDNGFHLQADVGRYLAGDVGATLSIKREFENGWKVGAFATKTNVSAASFGSGSFDKGITLEIPIGVFAGKPSRQKASTLIRPFGRDGGQRLQVDDRLYDTVRDYRKDGLSEQWGRFWK